MAKNDINLKQILLDKIIAKGGWVNTHAHIDRGFILNEENFKLVDGTLKEKWDFPDEFKRKGTVDSIYATMAEILDDQIAQGVQAIVTFIDVDPIIEDKAIKAAIRIRKDYANKIKIKFVNQVVKGVIDPEARRWFEIGAEFCDIIGGLPEKDAGHEAEHLDILFEAAKKNGGKMLHVHVDQLNLPEQRDTELLLQKTIEHNYQGKVVAVHAISVGAQPRDYRLNLYAKMKEAGVMVVACPVAWIDNSWIAGLEHDTIGPIHNSVTPVKEMINAGVTVSIGVDNIQDIYKPFADGDMWTDLRFLIESQRMYNLDVLSDIASVNGLKTMGL